MILKLLCLLPLLMMLVYPSQGYSKQPIRTLKGTVTKVYDGDSIKINSQGIKLKIRLYGIDAPETEKRKKKTGRVRKPGQPYGEEARKALEDSIYLTKIKVDVMDIDRHKRLVSVVWLNNRNINKEMIAQGWAWAFRKYLDEPYASEFICLEEQARQKRLGLWQQYNPQPPWKFKKMLKLK